jgi:hypothetical protein
METVTEILDGIDNKIATEKYHRHQLIKLIQLLCSKDPAYDPKRLYKQMLEHWNMLVETQHIIRKHYPTCRSIFDFLDRLNSNGSYLRMPVIKGDI